MKTMGFQIGNERLINLKDCQNLNIENLKELLNTVKENNKYGDIIWCDDLPDDKESKILIQNIEKQLEYNNENFSRFPSDYLHALFSYVVYKGLKENDKLDTLLIDLDQKSNNFQELSDWEVLKVFSEPREDKGLIKKGSIYFGALLINRSKNQMTLSHRGINADWLSWFKDKSPLMTNLFGIMLNESVPQMLCCYEVVENVIKDYAQHKDYKNYYLSFTGFANGAWLAQYSIYYSHNYFNYTKCKAVLFESPGFFKNEQKISSNIISPERDISFCDMNVVSYLTAPNLTNSCNKHVGIVYRVFLEQNVKSEKSQQFMEKFIDSFKNLEKVKSKLIKSKFLIDGLFNMFDYNNLKEIIKLFDKDTGKPSYYEQMLDWPLVGINFDKDYQENVNNYLINIPVDKIADNIPFAKILPEIFIDVSKKCLKYLGSIAIGKAVEFITPGLYTFLNILIEICKGNMDLDELDNDLFNKKLNELNEITTSDEYIDYKYSPEQDEKVKEGILKRIIKSFSSNFMKSKEENELEKRMKSKEKSLESKLKLLACYKPRHVSNYLKVLNINSDKENIDYCLNSLKSCLYLNDQKKLSDLLEKQLNNLKDQYDIKYELNEQLESVFCIYSNNKLLTIDTIKERLIRLLLLNGIEIKKLIKLPFNLQQLTYISKQLSNNFLIEDITNQYVGIIDFDSIYLKFVNEKKRKILVYGPEGFGKTVFASQFGRFFIQQKPHEQNICLSFQMGSKAEIKANFIDFLFKRLDLNKTKNQKIKIQMINDKLNNMPSRTILFIFDNVKYDLETEKESSFKLIKELFKDLPSKIIVLFISRENDKSFHEYFDYSEKMRGFNKDQAYDFFKNNLSHKKGKIESIMSKLDEMVQSRQMEKNNFKPLTLENIVRYIGLKKSKTIDEAIKSIKLDDKNIYQDLFDELINNEKNEEVKFLIEILGFLNAEKITFNFLKIIIDDENLIDLALRKLSNNSILYENDSKDDDSQIFFNFEQTLQTDLLKYLNTKMLKESIAKKLLDVILNYYKALTNEEFAAVKFYDLNHCLAIIKHGNDFNECFEFFRKINNLASSFKNAKKYEEAIRYYEKLIDIENIRNDKHEIYEIFLNLEKCHFQIGNVDEASYYKKKHEEIKKNDLTFDDDNLDSREEEEDLFKDFIFNLDEIEILQKRADIFYNIGFNIKRMGKYYEAFSFFEQSLYIYINKVLINASIDSMIVSKLKTNLDECYTSFKKSEQTFEYENKLIELDEKISILKLNLQKRSRKNEQGPKSAACIMS